MYTVEISHIAKSFGSVQAVADVSFAVRPGEIFGLLGPNGAGKTTSIRILLDIFKPNAGSASMGKSQGTPSLAAGGNGHASLLAIEPVPARLFPYESPLGTAGYKFAKQSRFHFEAPALAPGRFTLGGPMSEEKKNRIGYMPEERGLYQDIPLERCLVYLATLKGLSDVQARQQVGHYLEHFDLAPHKDKKVKELSKGMQQKAQIIATIAHRPELIVIDEPFTALDPVNTQMVKDLMRDMRDRGATILMSTHQMHQVEELCDRILLIDEGRDVLYGDLDDIRRRYAGHEVLVRTPAELSALPGVEAISPHNGVTRLTLAADTSSQDVLRTLLVQGVVVEQFEIAMPHLEEVFIRVVQEGDAS